MKTVLTGKASVDRPWLEYYGKKYTYDWLWEQVDVCVRTALSGTGEMVAADPAHGTHRGDGIHDDLPLIGKTVCDLRSVLSPGGY